LIRTTRLSIAGLMGIVAIASLGLTALRSDSPTWAGVMFLTTCAVLSLAVVGSLLREGKERTWWLGFAAFGWGYLALVFLVPSWSDLPITSLLDAIRTQINLPRGGNGWGRGLGGKGGNAFGGFGGMMITPPTDPYTQVGQCIFCLLLATAGGFLALLLFGAAPTTRRAGSDIPSESGTTRKRRLPPAMVGPSAFVAISLAALLGLRWAPGVCAGVVLMATWGWLVLASVAAFCRTGRDRAGWLGAAFFGIGYVLLTVGGDPSQTNWPHIATDRLLGAVRTLIPWFVPEEPPASDFAAASNARIMKALDRPISFPFRNETALEEVVKTIKAATKGPDGRGIPIYVDPIGLQEAEKTMASPISIDLEGVPLRTSLTFVLNQLDLSYALEGGVLVIGFHKGRPPSADSDPFHVVGHCLLALLASGLGALLARLVCGVRASDRDRFQVQVSGNAGSSHVA
jgi:hypothetical protein